MKTPSSYSAAALLAVVLVQGTLLVCATPTGDASPEVRDEHCLSEFPTASSELNTFVNTGHASRSLKCFLSCLYQANGKMAADGTLQFDVGLGPGSPKLPNSIVQEILPCYKIKPVADICETAFLHTTCLWDKENSLHKS